MIIRSRAPLRLGLAGGGTDLSPYCDEFGGAVLNETINLSAYCTIEEKNDGMCVFNATEVGKTYAMRMDDMASQPDPMMQLHVGVYRRIVKQFNGGKPLSFVLTTYNDAVMGSGLGGSSTMVVAILKCFTEWLKLPFGEYDIAHLAWEIERIDLNLAGGKQDQYAATFGGINYIEFYAGDKVIVNPLRVKQWIKCELEDSLVLYFTGKSRQSSNIIRQQVAAVQEREDRLQAMHELKKGAQKMKEAVLTGNFNQFADSLRESWEAKKRTSDAISNEQLDMIYNAVINAGGRAGKISGAGGGGFFMFYIDPTRRVEVLDALARFGGTSSFLQLTEHGTRGWIL